MSEKQKDDMFTQTEAVEFLQNSWKIKNVLKRMKTDRKCLVDEIVIQILANVPFQSITLVASKPEDRNCPSYEEIKKRCTSGKARNIYTSQQGRRKQMDIGGAGKSVYLG